MCGILFAASATEESPVLTQPAIDSIAHRGPDRCLRFNAPHIAVAFHRLAIHDLTAAGDQPFRLQEPAGSDHVLCCNGEIYNYQELTEQFALQPDLRGASDCEVLLPLLLRRLSGDHVALARHLHGVYAIVHWDARAQQVVVLRDRIGVKPLFYAQSGGQLYVSSEAKAIELLLSGSDGARIVELPPSHVGRFRLQDGVWSAVPELQRFWQAPEPSSPTLQLSDLEAVSRLRDVLTSAVVRRLGSERGVCCMLSGGLDSSIIAAVLAQQLAKQPDAPRLRTYSIGFPDSTDVKFARQVAAHIGSDHRECLIHYDQALAVLPQVVQAIESYDTTTVRASTPMFLLSQFIAANGDRVVFSGEGSDELFAGYLYNHLAPNAEAVRADSTRLVSELHMYDVLRADRCTAAHGLEFREPFLDQDLLDFALSLPGDQLAPRDGTEKWMLRAAFEHLLPESVAKRRKAAFSDAVSGAAKPWYRYIHEHYQLANASEENALYRRWFGERFHAYDRAHVPIWLPRWQPQVAGMNEPSATALTGVYRAEEHDKQDDDVAVTAASPAASQPRSDDV